MEAKLERKSQDKSKPESKKDKKSKANKLRNVQKSKDIYIYIWAETKVKLHFPHAKMRHR